MEFQLLAFDTDDIDRVNAVANKHMQLIATYSNMMSYGDSMNTYSKRNYPLCRP